MANNCKYKVQSELEYKKEFENGLHQTEYNKMRFNNDRINLSIQNVKKIYGYDFDPAHIENLRDVIIYDQLYNLDPKKTLYADKIGLYNLIDESLQIPKLYSKYTKHIESLDYKSPFILKCNHGSGWNIIIKDGYDFKYVKKTIDTWLNLNYAYISPCFEQQYENIEPGYLIQPLLAVEPYDWQLYYIDGELEIVEISKKIAKSVISVLASVDKDGNKKGYTIGGNPILDNLNNNMKNSLKRIRESADNYAKRFKFVRLDYFYLDKPYICEFTFSPSSGFIDLKPI